MSSSPRIKRRRKVGRNFTKHSVRRAFPFLLEDFKGRCAYSMRHVDVAGDVAMHIDLFDPRLKKHYQQPYWNLYLATAGCNIAKRDNWPTPAEVAAGARFLDPCKEKDYGVHRFENPITHEVVGVTPAGRYQILICDLNASHLIIERAERAALRRILFGPAKIKTTSFAAAKEAIVALRQQYERKIPPVEPPP